MPKHLVVIGGGAAGFFCAVNAARLNPDVKVSLLERHDKVLQKVKISGGGRCNLTHQIEGIAGLSKHYPRGQQFLKKAFTQFAVNDTLAWFAERHVTTKAEEDGRMFPISDSSQTIIDCLLRDADRYHVSVLLHHEVMALQPNGQGFSIQLRNKPTLEADFVMVAVGGYTKLEHFEWLRQLGHQIEPPVPSLFTFNIPDKHLTAAMGVVAETAQVRIVGTKLIESGPILITHWGLSGPAILRLSAWGAIELAAMNYHFAIQINWTGIPEHELRAQWNNLRAQQSDLKLGQKNPFGLAQRIWEYLLHHCELDSQHKWSELTSKAQNKLIHALCAQEMQVKGKTTFKKEFVTCGGITLSEIDPLTMQSKLIPNLFFGGEIMNVDGITGGFNFQHAWTSGYLAAKAIAEKARTALT